MRMSEENHPHENAVWGAVFAETLARLGLREVVIAPGSRSTPMVCALVAHAELHCTPILDERTAGFYALGKIRGRGRPVLVVCTSGTAGANLYPAVIEAREDHLPLLCVTADRPPEMRFCRSGQTIDQLGLFGRYPVFSTELALPSLEDARLRHLRQTLVHSWHQAVGWGGGPVHLNVPLRDPLAPIPVAGKTVRFSVEPFCASARAVSVRPKRNPPESLDGFPQRGVIVAGGISLSDPVREAEMLHKLGRGLGWPILADPLSSVRFRNRGEGEVVGAYDMILRNPTQAKELQPEGVLQIGPLPTSKVLRAWLSDGTAPRWMLTEHGDNLDPTHGDTTPWACSLKDLVAPAPQPPTNWEKQWMDAEATAWKSLATGMDDLDFPFAGSVAWSLERLLPEGARLFLASSMPVRDVEYFTAPNDRRWTVYANRGANGIDGTLGTILGLADPAAPLFALTGDLAFLHDTNALLTVREVRGSVTILLLDNGGGGIFEHLPVAQIPGDMFTRFFATPQSVDFPALVGAYGVDFQVVATIPELVAELSRKPQDGVRVLCWRSDRKRDAAQRRDLLQG